MKPEDMDKTQLMRPVDGQSQGAARDRKFDTQPLPAIHDEETGGIQPAFPKQTAGESDNFRGVRELPALLGGFMLAGYSQDHSEAKQNQQQMERQQMQAKEKKLADQEADLKARRQELERQKQELQARERELEEKSSRAKGRNEAITSQAPDSALGKLVDKVTGKEAKRQDQLQQNEKVSAQADSDVAKLKQSIAEAQSMLDDVDAKLDTVSEMQQEASRIKAKAESAYAENKDVIDKAVYYAKTGADFLSQWFTK